MSLIIALLAFAVVSIVVWTWGRPSEDPVRRRIRGEQSRIPALRGAEGSFTARIIGPLARQLGEPLTKLLPHHLVHTAERMLIMANAPMTTAQFLTVWALSAATGTVILLFVLYSNPSASLAQYLLLSLLVTGPFVIGPYVVLRRKGKARQKAISRALPDALDLLVTGVEAGLGVDAAFAMVTDKTAGPLSEAFASYLRQVGLGRGRREAFTDVAERTGVVDLIRLAAATAQAEQMGATLGDVLRVQADDLRTLRRQRAQEAAQRAPVLMTIPMALCFLPAMGAVVIVPSVLNLLDFLHRMGPAR